MTKPNLPLSNVLYNVQVYRGVTGGRKLLSCSGTGDRVDLWTTDDDSNRQKWQFIPLPDEPAQATRAPEPVEPKPTDPV